MTKAPDIMWVFPRKDWFNAGASTHKIQCAGGKDVEYVSRSRCDALVAKAQADALREAADVCTTVIKNYSVMKPDGKTYEPMRVQEAAKGMVRLARQDIENLIPETSHD